MEIVHQGPLPLLLLYQIYIGRITLREQEIANYREFWNPTWNLDAFV